MTDDTGEGSGGNSGVVFGLSRPWQRFKNENDTSGTVATMTDKQARYRSENRLQYVAFL
jgi:hypothetical protein